MVCATSPGVLAVFFPYLGDLEERGPFNSVNFAFMFKHVTVINNKYIVYIVIAVVKFINFSPQASLLLIFVTILITFFCNLNILLLIEEFPQNILPRDIMQ
jgi:hypothetical protein